MDPGIGPSRSSDPWAFIRYTEYRVFKQSLYRGSIALYLPARVIGAVVLKGKFDMSHFIFGQVSRSQYLGNGIMLSKMEI